MQDKYLGNKNYFDSIDINVSKKWRDVAYTPFSLKVITSILRSIHKNYFQGINRALDWIDVGCGLGRTSLIAEKLGYNYTGIDCSSKHIDFCLNTYNYGKFIDHDWLLHTGKYDLISFISSLHHFEDWEAALNKGFSLLRSGGIILIDHEPNRLYSKLFRFYTIYFRKVDPVIIGSVEIHWFQKPSILPSELPKGKVEYHFDYFPILGYLRLKTKKKWIGKFFESYRKIIQK